MNREGLNRRLMLASLGGTFAIQGPGRSPIAQDLQAVLDKIARTDAGFAEPRIPVTSLPSSSSAMHVISRPGSYYVPEDMRCDPGKTCIDITSGDVDLDGCGFHINGGGGGGGIAAKGSNITISDLSINDCRTGCDVGSTDACVIWDVSAMRCAIGFVLGGYGQAYDLEAYDCPAAGFLIRGERCHVEECGAFRCGTGFSSSGTGNFLISNSATRCGISFDLAPTNSWGPIVKADSVGDISASDPRSGHPCANFVY